MNLTQYKHLPFKLTVNKKMIPITYFTFKEVGAFNKIYLYCKKHFTLVKPTNSKGISQKDRFCERYFVLKGNERFELVVVCADGCYRFVIRNPLAKDNIISGTTACREIYKAAAKYGIDFNKYKTEDGKSIKEKILSPHIEVLDTFFLGRVLNKVHHIDLNSSYASRICEYYPELYPMYDELYAKRKLNNGYYKHILTNSIGCWQSEFCVDPSNGRTTKPYMFANLSLIAINGTRRLIEAMIQKLIASGRRPLLSNTDGIWYYGNIYHDEKEGIGLGQWKHDHLNCQFLMESKGIYQYVENNVCNSVVRGICNLDAIEPDRSKWKFGDIKLIKSIATYSFDPEKGVIKNG